MKRNGKWYGLYYQMIFFSAVYKIVLFSIHFSFYYFICIFKISYAYMIDMTSRLTLYTHLPTLLNLPPTKYHSTGIIFVKKCNSGKPYYWLTWRLKQITFKKFFLNSPKIGLRFLSKYWFLANIYIFIHGKKSRFLLQYSLSFSAYFVPQSLNKNETLRFVWME